MKEQMMRHWLARIGIVLVALGIGYAVYIRTLPQSGAPNPMMGRGIPAVDVAAAIGREVHIWHEFSGKLAAVNQAEVRPRVSGMIESVLFTDGAYVKQGAPLFKIDPKPYQAAVNIAKGELSAAQAQVVLAKSNLIRGKTLLADGFIPQSNYDQRKNESSSAEARLQSAKAALEAVQLDLGYTNVTAPISGRVGRAEITAGNIVSAGSNAPLLTRVVAQSPIYGEFNMDESSFLHFPRIENNQIDNIPVMLGLSSEEGTPHTGYIRSFDNRLDPQSGSIRVRALFDNESGLLVPGLFARIHISAPKKILTILISDRAIGTDQDKKFVLVVGKDNIAQYRIVKLGGLIDGLRAIDDGLSAGEKIIINGRQRVRAGASVAPQDVDMETGRSLSSSTAPSRVKEKS